MRTNSSYWYWIYFWFCARRLFSEDSYFANDHGTIRQYFFIAIASWWLLQFSPTSRQNLLLFRCERISSLISLLQSICVSMQCWLDDRVYFMCHDSLQAISEEGQQGRKGKEKHWDFIPSTSERQINSSRMLMSVSFYRFLRQVSTNIILPVPFWILMRTKHFLPICSMHSLVYVLYDNWQSLCRLLPNLIDVTDIHVAGQ
jgi:hypothetical protein